MTGTVRQVTAVRMKVLLLSTRPLGAAEIDRVLLSGLHPSAVDVCPSVNLALSRLDTFPPDLVIVNLPERDGRRRGAPSAGTKPEAPDGGGGAAVANSTSPRTVPWMPATRRPSASSTGTDGSTDLDVDVLTRTAPGATRPPAGS